MAIITPETSGAAISQGQGQGYAQVFGQSSFDPVEFAKNVAAKQEARRLKELDDELKTREKNAKASVVAEDVGLYNEEEIYKAVEDYNEQLAKFQVMGIDIEGSPEGRAILNRGNSEIKALNEADKVLQDRMKYFENLAQQNPGKYDLEELATYKKQLADIKGVKNKARFALENSPFAEPEYDLNDMYKGIAETVGEVTQKIPGGAETMWPEEAVGELTKTYIMGMPELERQAAFEAGKKKGLWNSLPEMIEATKKQIIPMGSVKRTFNAPTGQGDFTFSAGGVKMPKNVRIAGKQTPLARVPGGYGEIAVKMNGKDLPPMEVIDRAGKTVYFKPATYYVGGFEGPGKSRAVPRGKIGVKGKVFGRTGEEKIKPGEDPATVKVRLEDANEGAEVVQQGDRFIIYKPLADDVIDYDTNDIRFQTAIGVDLNEWLDAEDAKISGGGGGGTQSGGKQTDVSNIFE